VLTVADDRAVRLWLVDQTSLLNAMRHSVSPCLEPDERGLDLGESKEQAESEAKRCREGR
jgi:hypothetical protein